MTTMIDSMDTPEVKLFWHLEGELYNTIIATDQMLRRAEWQLSKLYRDHPELAERWGNTRLVEKYRILPDLPSVAGA